MHEIRIDQPGKNALSSALMAFLESELTRAHDSPILLTGTGDAFSAGLDLREVAELDESRMEKFLRRLDVLCARIFDHPAPVVAAINGHAIAGGCVIAACCDWRIAQRNPKTKIGVNEVAIGACFPPVILRILRQRFPNHLHEKLLLGAGLYGVDEALAHGLVDEVADDAVAAARERLAKLAAHPRTTYALTKRNLRAGVTRTTPDEELRFVEREVPLWTSPEMKARVLAVLKR